MQVARACGISEGKARIILLSLLDSGHVTREKAVGYSGTYLYIAVDSPKPVESNDDPEPSQNNGRPAGQQLTTTEGNVTTYRFSDPHLSKQLKLQAEQVRNERKSPKAHLQASSTQSYYTVAT
jgi:hypothetical protein